MWIRTAIAMVGWGLLGLGGEALAALPAAGVEATASTRYNSDVDGPVTATAGDPGAANATSSAGPGGPGIGTILGEDTFNASTARARALLPGTIGSYSHAGGFSPGFAPPAGSLDAQASARTVTHWMVVSNDPSITSVGVDVFAFFDGALVTARYAGAGPGDLTAAVDARMHAIDASGQIYDYHESGTLDHAGAFAASAGWSGSWTTSASSSGNDRRAALAYSDFFDDAFRVNVGEEFAWEVVLSTTAHALAPFELWAIADFFNTGDFELSVDTPGVTLVEVVPVPLPASLPLLLAAAVPLMRRARRLPRAL